MNATMKLDWGMLDVESNDVESNDVESNEIQHNILEECEIITHSPHKIQSNAFNTKNDIEMANSIPRTKKWVALESPYFSILPWNTMRNYQYAILAFKYESANNKVVYASHITYTQWVMCGLNSFLGDFVSEFVEHKLWNLGAGSPFKQLLSRGTLVSIKRRSKTM